MNQIKSEGTQSFAVPNTEEGKAFIKLLRQYANRPDCSIKVRGRGNRPPQLKGKFRDGLPLGLATWFAVYIRSAKVDKRISEIYRSNHGELDKRREKIESLEKQVRELRIALVDKQEQYVQEHSKVLELRERISHSIKAEYKPVPAYDPNPPVPVENVRTVTIASVKGANVRIVLE